MASGFALPTAVGHLGCAHTSARKPARHTVKQIVDFAKRSKTNRRLCQAQWNKSSTLPNSMKQIVDFAKRSGAPGVCPHSGPEADPPMASGLALPNAVGHLGCAHTAARKPARQWPPG